MSTNLNVGGYWGFYTVIDPQTLTDPALKLPMIVSISITEENKGNMQGQTILILHQSQGRIQDLKLGVAQMDWKILKTGVGGWGVGGIGIV